MPFLDLGDKTLFYSRVDPESPRDPSPVLVFIHGLGSSHSFYTSVMSQLADTGYSSIALDVHGSGLSELSSKADAPSFASIAEDVANLLSKLDIPIDNVVAVGHSMGGIIVPLLAAKHSLRGAFLIGPVLPKPGLADIFSSRVETVKQHGMEAMAKTIPFAATGSKANSTQKAFIRTLLLSQRTDGYIALCQAIAKAERPVYSDANCPLFVVAGEEDKTSPVPDSRTILDSWSSWGCDEKSKTIQVLPGVGHWHCIEAADEVGWAMRAFMATLN
ncbi:hypothetical protein FZEAL_2057 [Fusarium zealandicum]|uniref:Serine aminopeptidase S33 domain-containing protein n=1 Tax=Fusarium zealandicum TaxID=1053134 RepID=A0A8H4XNX7_9HYPO|nr:hypothetical protein FZEAL_2057 [Fusarium zealandicum]